MVPSVLPLVYPTVQIRSVLFSLFVNDVVSIFQFSRCLLEVDDLKLSCKICYTEEALKLQLDFPTFLFGVGTGC